MVPGLVDGGELFSSNEHVRLGVPSVAKKAWEVMVLRAEAAPCQS